MKTPLARDVYGLVRERVCKLACAHIYTPMCVRESKHAVKKNNVGYLLIPLTAESEGKSKLTHVSNTSTRQDRGKAGERGGLIHSSTEG